MAWIVKDSANAQIERRDEPYLTDAMKAKFEKDILPRYPTKQAALLPLCHELQHAYHYLPAQSLEEAAEFLELSYAEVMDCVSFYEEYKLEPVGEDLVQICRSIGCELCGYRELSKKVQDKLDILPGETTDDGQFTLLELECIGACELAPAVLLGEDLAGPMTWESLEAEIDKRAKA